MVRVALQVAGEPLVFDVPVAYRWIDRVQGERYRALEIVPPVTCRFDQRVYLFPSAAARKCAAACRARMEP